MSDVRLEFPASDGFGWDENKSDANLPKHGIAFAEASEAFDGAVVVTRSDRNHEERWVAVGKSHGRMVTIVFTVRNQVIWTSQRVTRGQMKEERIVRRRWGERRKGKTDWKRFDAMTEEEIGAAIASDPDWDEFRDIDWSNAVLVMPAKKKAISIRVDEDVLDFFKKEGEGYQRRMNAVLRSYMQQKSKPKKRA
jgi:uncharacterized protein (DUF4415 family)